MERPKKIRIIVIIIILMDRAHADLMNDIVSSLNVTMADTVFNTTFGTMVTTDEGNWTKEQEDIYSAFDNLGTTIENDSTGSQIEAAFDAWRALL